MNRCSPTPRMHQLCLQNHTIDITVFPSGSLCISPLCIMPEDWHHITVSLFLCILLQLLFLRDRKIKSQSFLTPPLHASHICLLTPWAWHRFSATHVQLKHGLGWVWWLSFMAQVVVQHRHWWQRVAHLCSPTHALLTISTSSTLSFSSGALTNIPHTFLMHSHMVVLFFFLYCAKKSEWKKKLGEKKTCCKDLALSVVGQNVSSTF